MLKIRVLYKTEIDDDFQPLEKLTQGDWIDVRAAETHAYSPGDFFLMPLGFACELPKGYEAHIATRSSLFKSTGVLMANSHGVIDESYCGDGDQWYFPSYATRAVVIKRGDRIAQFRIVEKMPVVEFEVVDHLGNSNRGGIGSTGVK